MKLEFRDRHAEHADGREELCHHSDFDFLPGDIAKFDARMGGSVIAEVEIEYVNRKTMRVTLNQLDYLIERAKRRADLDVYHEWFDKSRGRT